MDRKKTNGRQFAKLAEIMEENPEVAKGSNTLPPEAVTAVWWRIKDALNSLGPPNRTVVRWQKVWRDKKRKIKDRLQHNKREMRATGGGPNTLHTFNDVEQTIIRLLSLERAVSLGGSVFGVQQQSERTSTIGNGAVEAEDPEEAMVVEDEPVHAVELAEDNQDHAPHEDGANLGANRGNRSATRGRGRIATRRNFRKALLEKQTDDLEKIRRHVSDCARYARKSHDVQTKRLELETKVFQFEQEKFRFEKEMKLEKQKRHYDQLQYQLQKLQLKKQKLDFEMKKAANERDDHEETSENSDDERVIRRVRL